MNIQLGSVCRSYAVVANAVILSALIGTNLNINAASAADQRKRVLIVSSYNPLFPLFGLQVSGLRAAPAQRDFDNRKIIMDIEFMDSKRFPKSRQIHLFRAAFAKKMATLRLYDIDVVGDDNAFSFAQREQHRGFGKCRSFFSPLTTSTVLSHRRKCPGYRSDI
jgi:hypothetical protein